MRKKYIEYLRVISMFAVIAIHVCITALGNFDCDSTTANSMYLSIRNVFHFAVPVFFMITGALMLPDKKEMGIKKLLSRYLLKYGLVIIIFGSGYALLEEVFTKKTFNFRILATGFMNMLCGKSWEHMWYMYALFGAVLLVPVLRAVVSAFDNRQRNYLIICMFLFLSFLPCIKELINFSLGISFPISSVYCLYMLIGYWIDSGEIKISRKYSVLTLAICVLVLILMSIFQIIYSVSMEAFTAYSSPLILALSVSIFSLAKNMEINLSEKTPAFIVKIGELSFGVYLIHMLWINILYKLLEFNPFSMNAVISFVIVFIAVSVLSLFSVWIMKKIPFVRKLI